MSALNIQPTRGRSESLKRNRETGGRRKRKGKDIGGTGRQKRGDNTTGALRQAEPG